MRVLVTGHNGYLGSVLVPMLQAAGHDVIGLDTYFFESCTFGDAVPDVAALRKDIRDVEAPDLAGVDAVIHLAALCNDPLGDLDVALTNSINHEATVRLALIARQAGVERFLFSSSCSAYGAAGAGMLTEEASFNPVTPYAVSKIRSEGDLSKLSDAGFSPTFLRNATAYGCSPRLRGDLVINNLVGLAYTTGEVLIKSDGTPLRPVVHTEDIARAFLACLHAPRELIHNQAFNVGSSQENYQVRELAELVEEVVPGSRVRYAEGAGPDLRSYRVDCSKIAATLPEFRPQWTARAGMEELYDAFKRNALTSSDDLDSGVYSRLGQIKRLIEQQQVDATLRWQTASTLKKEAIVG